MQLSQNSTSLSVKIWYELTAPAPESLQKQKERKQMEGGGRGTSTYSSQYTKLAGECVVLIHAGIRPATPPPHPTRRIGNQMFKFNLSLSPPPVIATCSSDWNLNVERGQCQRHRSRIDTEEKAKVVAAVWGGRMCSIPCCASCFAPGWLGQICLLDKYKPGRGCSRFPHFFHFKNRIF